MEWSDKFNLGIESIDQQHRNWLKIMNELLGASKTSDRQKNLKHALNQIVQYGQEHLEYEESLFEQFSYPETVQHKQEHENLKSKIRILLDDLDGGKIVLASLILAEMNNWLLHHICIEDKKYVTFLKSKGVK